MEHKRLDIEYKDINILKNYEKNPRLNDEAVPLVVKSIQEFGMKVPVVVDSNDVIVCGHTRVKALKELGETQVPCIVADDLSPEQIKAFRLADNKVAEAAGWDFELLDTELADLCEDFDMEDFGFILEDYDSLDGGEYVEDDEESLSEDMIEVRDHPERTLEEEPEPEDIPVPVGATIIQRGDIVNLGRHRLSCGDSTSREDFARLMDGVTADIAFTSPPYNAGHLGTGRAQDGAKYLHDTDQRTNQEYEEFLQTIVDLMLENSEEVFLNIGVLKGSKQGIISLLNAERDRFKDFIYWKKNNPVPALAKNHLSSAVELIIAFGHDGSRMFRHDPGIWYGVIEGNWAGKNPYSGVHRATFPLYLPTEIINHMTDEGATVLDPFGGTGTTLIACEDTGRTCYMQELEPAYCDLIVRRYIERVGTDDGVELIRDGKKVDVNWDEE